MSSDISVFLIYVFVHPEDKSDSSLFSIYVGMYNKTHNSVNSCSNRSLKVFEK